MESDAVSTTDEIMFAVFDGKQEFTDAMYEEVKNFATYIKKQEGNNK